MLIPALPVPLSCRVNTIMENGETAHEKNNRLRVQIGLPPLAQPRITQQLDTGYIGSRKIYTKHSFARNADGMTIFTHKTTNETSSVS